MDKRRAIGAAKVVKGWVRVGVHTTTGDPELRPQAAADKVAGKVQNAVATVKDRARGTREILNQGFAGACPMWCAPDNQPPVPPCQTGGAQERKRAQCQLEQSLSCC